MTQLAETRIMPCCKANLPLDLIAPYSIIVHCTQYPALEMLKVSCPRCREAMHSFLDFEIELYRKNGAADIVDDDHAEAMALMFREELGYEPLRIKFLGNNQRSVLQKFHRLLEHIDTVDQLEVA